MGSVEFNDKEWLKEKDERVGKNMGRGDRVCTTKMKLGKSNNNVPGYT